MPHGTKTTACATLAAGSAGIMFFDPTLVSLATFTAASTGAALGTTYHCGRKVVDVFRNRKKHPDVSDEKFNPVEVEEIIRKLASSFIGITISGGLAIVLPHKLVGTALGAVEFIVELRKLQKMAKTRGTSVRDLLRSISKLDIATQIMAGFVLKAAFTVLFLGSDFEIWAKSIGVDLQSGVPGGEGIASWLQGLAADHQSITSHGFLANTTGIANGPGDAMTEILTGSTTTPVWHGGEEGTAIIGIGTAEAATDFILGKLVEEPAHEAVNILFQEGRSLAAFGQGRPSLGHEKSKHQSLLPSLCDRNICQSRVVTYEKIRHL